MSLTVRCDKINALLLNKVFTTKRMVTVCVVKLQWVLYMYVVIFEVLIFVSGNLERQWCAQVFKSGGYTKLMGFKFPKLVIFNFYA